MKLSDALKIYNSVKKKRDELRRALVGHEVVVAKGVRAEGSDWEIIFRKRGE